MTEEQRCPRCGRVQWMPFFGAIDGETCHYLDGPECRALTDRNTLVAALRSVLRQDAPDALTRRTAAAVLEQIVGCGHECPLCRKPHSVRNGAALVHFAETTDSKPCPASFKRVIGGVLQ